MSQPANTRPAQCPRVDGTSGPRRCPFVECPEHLWEVRASGARPNQLRVLAQRQCDDTCALDVAERAKVAADRSPNKRAKHTACSLREIGVLLAMAEPNVHRLLKRALHRYRIGLLRERSRG